MWPHPRPSFKTPQWLPCSIRWRSSLCKHGSRVWARLSLQPCLTLPLPSDFVLGLPKYSVPLQVSQRLSIKPPISSHWKRSLCPFWPEVTADSCTSALCLVQASVTGHMVLPSARTGKLESSDVSPCCVPCVPSTTQRHSQQSESVTSASQGQSPAHCNIPNPQRQTTRSPSHWTGAPGNPHCSWRHFYAISALVSHVRFLTSFVPNVLYCMPGSVLGWTDEWTRGRGMRREGRVEGENSEERGERGKGGDSQALSPLSGNSEPTGSVYNPKSSIQKSSLHIT